ncbi:hypothetical protein OIO90_005872 [Microbotryomycetes sp. JL221]|nr:hypothetical protein OIO90_005872 [Microbotryomycetes sp. JL221]
MINRVLSDDRQVLQEQFNHQATDNAFKENYAKWCAQVKSVKETNSPEKAQKKVTDALTSRSEFRLPYELLEALRREPAFDKLPKHRFSVRRRAVAVAIFKIFPGQDLSRLLTPHENLCTIEESQALLSHATLTRVCDNLIPSNDDELLSTLRSSEALIWSSFEFGLGNSAQLHTPFGTVHPVWSCVLSDHRALGKTLSTRALDLDVPQFVPAGQGEHYLPKWLEVVKARLDLRHRFHDKSFEHGYQKWCARVEAVKNALAVADAQDQVSLCITRQFFELPRELVEAVKQDPTFDQFSDHRLSEPRRVIAIAIRKIFPGQALSRIELADGDQNLCTLVESQALASCATLSRLSSQLSSNNEAKDANAHVLSAVNSSEMLIWTSLEFHPGACILLDTPFGLVHAVWSCVLSDDRILGQTLSGRDIGLNVPRWTSAKHRAQGEPKISLRKWLTIVERISHESQDMLDRFSTVFDIETGRILDCLDFASWNSRQKHGNRRMWTSAVVTAVVSQVATHSADYESQSGPLEIGQLAMLFNREFPVQSEPRTPKALRQADAFHAHRIPADGRQRASPAPAASTPVRITLPRSTTFCGMDEQPSSAGTAKVTAKLWAKLDISALPSTFQIEAVDGFKRQSFDWTRAIATMKVRQDRSLPREIAWFSSQGVEGEKVRWMHFWDVTSASPVRVLLHGDHVQTLKHGLAQKGSPVLGNTLHSLLVTLFEFEFPGQWALFGLHSDSRTRGSPDDLFNFTVDDQITARCIKALALVQEKLRGLVREHASNLTQFYGRMSSFEHRVLVSDVNRRHRRDGRESEQALKQLVQDGLIGSSHELLQLTVELSNFDPSGVLAQAMRKCMLTREFREQTLENLFMTNLVGESIRPHVDLILVLDADLWALLDFAAKYCVDDVIDSTGIVTRRRLLDKLNQIGAHLERNVVQATSLGRRQGRIYNMRAAQVIR